MSFQVLRGITLPTHRNAAGSKYPLKDLQIGDGFFVANAKKSVQVTLSKNAKSQGVTITTRRMQGYASYDAEGNGIGELVDGLMVQRIAPKAAA